jgi:hypothetical protein
MLTGAVVSLVADIGERLGHVEALQEREDPLRLRRINRTCDEDFFDRLRARIRSGTQACASSPRSGASAPPRTC